jgi:hypothetical protein
MYGMSQADSAAVIYKVENIQLSTQDSSKMFTGILSEIQLTSDNDANYGQN